MLFSVTETIEDPSKQFPRSHCTLGETYLIHVQPVRINGDSAVAVVKSRWGCLPPPLPNFSWLSSLDFENKRLHYSREQKYSISPDPRRIPVNIALFNSGGCCSNSFVSLFVFLSSVGGLKQGPSTRQTELCHPYILFKPCLVGSLLTLY